MFEKIVLRRSQSGPALTVGELAEALLFYQNVHLVLDYPTLSSLVDRISMRGLLSLLSRPNVSAIYCEETLGTHTEQVGAVQRHRFVAFTLAGDQKAGQLTSRKKRLEFILERKGHSRREARRLVERFRERVPIRMLTNDYFLPGGVTRAASEDLLDAKFVHEAIRRVLSHTEGIESTLGRFTFEVISAQPHFLIETNIDFEALNARRKSRYPGLDPVTPAHLINELLMARADTALASHYGGEFYTSALTSEVIRLRYAELLKRIGIESNELRELKEIVISGSPSVREVIDRGERSFDEFLALLEKSQRFRDWIQSVNPDEKLVQAYFKDVTAEGWIAKLPVKALRYILGSVLSLARPLEGLVLSAVDALFLEKLLRGWRPNHFIETRLKPFVNTENRGDV